VPEPAAAKPAHEPTAEPAPEPQAAEVTAKETQHG
jgi:hypothetical protein